MSGDDHDVTPGVLERLGLPDIPETRALVGLIDQSVTRLDRSGRILGMALGRRDRRAVEAFGTDELLADPNRLVTEFLDETARGELLSAVHESLLTGEPVDFEFSSNAGGRTVHFVGSCSPCGPNEVILVTWDRTRHVQARRSASARMELEAMVNDCLQSLVGVDGDELVRAMDSVMMRIAGYFGAQSSYVRRFRDPSHVEVVTQWRSRASNVAAPGSSLAGGGVFPWAARQLARNPILVVGNIEDLDDSDAAIDHRHFMTRSGGRALVWVRVGPPRRPSGILGLVFDEPLSERNPDAYEPLLGLAHSILSAANRSLDRIRRDLQHQLFELLACGAPLADVLVEVCRLRESGWPGQHAHIWARDRDGTLVCHGADERRAEAINVSYGSPEIGPVERSVLGERTRRWVLNTPGDAAEHGGDSGGPLVHAIEVTPLLSGAHSEPSGLLVVRDTSIDPLDPQVAEPGFSDLAASLATLAIERVRDLSELSHRATHDALTGLANRSTFLERLAESIARTAAQVHLTAVLYCDVDRFKELNDQLGHATGDHLLRLVGERIAKQVGLRGTVARLGGDEFAVLLDDLVDEEQAMSTAADILATVRELSTPGGRSVSVSIGVAVSGSNVDHADGLLRDADMAMYLAKSSGRDRVEIFRERIRRRAQERDRLSQDLAVAISDGTLDVHFQPVVSLGSGRIVGFESLARWTHSSHGSISPDVFVPIAEASGLICPLGELVTERALDCASKWTDQILHVNLSAHQVDAPGAVERLLDIVSASGVPSDRLAMEITETVLLSDSPSTARNLSLLLDAGIGLVLDDFGTGYASLTSLRRIPFRGIKVDKSFVAGMGSNPEDATIVSMVLGLAASLDLEVVAEGVETLEQERALRSMGCTHVQGFQYSRAVPAHEVPALLARFGAQGTD